MKAVLYWIFWAQDKNLETIQKPEDLSLLVSRQPQSSRKCNVHFYTCVFVMWSVYFVKIGVLVKFLAQKSNEQYVKYGIAHLLYFFWCFIFL